MKNSLINKTVAVTLSVILLSSEVSANNLSSLFGTATTKASEWTSPATGEKFFYSGSYQFTFNNGNNYAPWINASEAGGITAGCSGISIKNMFVSLIGLDKIKDQLSSAGASIGWGVMLALISSMPILDKTFARIRKWGRVIQALLQNACNFGKMLGNSYFSKTWKDLQQNAIGKGSYLDSVDEGSKKVDKWLNGKFDDFGFDADSAECKDDKSAASVKCRQFFGVASSSEIKSKNSLKVTSVLTAVVGNKIGMGSLATNDTIYIDLLSNFLSDGKIAGQELMTNEDNRKFAQDIVVMSRLFFGDFVYSSDSIKMILEDTDCDGLGADKKCKLSPTKIKAKIKSKLKSGEKSKITPTESYIAPIFSPESAANVFLNGVKKSSCKKGCSDGSVKIPNSYILYGTKTFSTTGVNTAEIGASTSSTSTTTTTPATPVTKEAAIIFGGSLPTNGTSDMLTVEWKGAIVESLKQIKFDVKSKSGVTVNYGYLDEEKMEVDGSNGGSIPIVIPGYGKIIETIAKIEKARSRETAFTASLKELVAKYNAYLYSKSLVGYMNGFVLTSLQSTGNGDKKADIQIMIDNIRDVSKDIQEKLDDSIGDIKKFNTIMETFEKIDKEFRTELNNNMQ